MITNKKEPKTAMVPLEEGLLERYLENMVPGLNARLLEEQKAGAGDKMRKMLWVESITLTAYGIENDEEKGR